MEKKVGTDDVELTKEFRRELIALVQQPRYNTIPLVVIRELLALAGVMMFNGVKQTPSMLPELLFHVDQLREYVDAAGETATTH